MMDMSVQYQLSEKTKAAVGFTDAPKSAFGYIIHPTGNRKPIIFKQAFMGSVQLGELVAIASLFRDWPDPINIFSNSQYATNVTKSLPFASLKPTEGPLYLFGHDLAKDLDWDALS